MENLDFSLLATLRPQLLRRVRQQVHDSAVADDIVQDVLLQAHVHADGLRDPDRLAAWLHRIAHNRVIDYFRSRKRSLPAPHSSSEEYNPYNDCVSDCLSEEIQHLPDKYREAIEQVEVNSLRQIDVATRLGLTYSGLKSRVQRARQLVRERLLEKYIIESDAYGNILRCEDNPQWKGACDCQVKG